MFSIICIIVIIIVIVVIMYSLFSVSDEEWSPSYSYVVAACW